MDSGTRRKNATRETTSTLKAWLQEHRKNPYPTKGEKITYAGSLAATQLAGEKHKDKYPRPHRRRPTRLPRPWDSPGKNTGVPRHLHRIPRLSEAPREVP